MGFVGTVFASWLTRKSKTSYKYYYKKYVRPDTDLGQAIIDVLAQYAGNSYTYSVYLMPDNTTICADMLCFRNPAAFYDYSSYGQMRVRLMYERGSELCVIICQKRYQLEAFIDKMSADNFDAKNDLVFIGTG